MFELLTSTFPDEVELDTLPDEELEDDRFPDDELDTFPDEDTPLDELLDTLMFGLTLIVVPPLDELEPDPPAPDEVETFPDELDTLPDEDDTLPEEDETEPDELLETTLPDEEEDETTLPPELDEVDETTKLPPPPPPKAKPPPKPPGNPPKKPPPPPTTAGIAPTGAPSGACMGNGTGAAWLATVTTAGGQAAALATVVTRRTRGRDTAAVRRCTTRFACLTRYGRGLPSATWTAPPPSTAPPAAHAQSFAIAIRTDMQHSSLFAAPYAGAGPEPCGSMPGSWRKNAK